MKRLNSGHEESVLGREDVLRGYEFEIRFDKNVFARVQNIELDEWSQRIIKNEPLLAVKILNLNGLGELPKHQRDVIDRSQWELFCCLKEDTTLTPIDLDRIAGAVNRYGIVPPLADDFSDDERQILRSLAEQGSDLVKITTPIIPTPSI